MFGLRSLGRVRVHAGNGEPVRLRSRKHLALLLYLACHTGRRHRRARLAGLLWQTEPRLARHSLSQALYDIRSSLPGLGVGGGVEHVVLEDPDLTFDVSSFEEAVRDDRIGEAVALYDGDFAPELDGVGGTSFERWLERERSRLRRLAEMALFRHVESCDARGRWGELCLSALKLVEMNPLHEGAHRALMRGLWLRGDQTNALRHYESSVVALENELPGGLSTETRRLVEKIRSSRPPAGVASEEKPGSAPMIGRGREFEALGEALARARENASRVVVVDGEAGMGKTRLVEEFAGSLRLEDVRVLRSRCYAAESSIPFGPVIEGLRPVVRTAPDSPERPAFFHLGRLFPGAFPTPLPEDSEPGGDLAAPRRRLFEELADLVRRLSAERTLVWIVEDVHWIDASSAALFHYLARRLSGSPILLVLTARSHEERAEAAELLLDPGARGEVERLRLRPLTREQTDELVDAASPGELDPRLRSRVHELSGGNPFFVLEILRSPPGPRDLRPEEEPSGYAHLITEELATLLRHRLRGLEVDALRLLEIVAVAGRHATPALVSAVSGIEVGRLADLARTLYGRGLLRDRESRLDFHHDITREFVSGSLGHLQRAALHLSTGEVLSAEGTAGPGTLARHFHLGGDRERACVHATRAAGEAGESFGHEETIRFGRLAVATAKDSGERHRALELLSRAEVATGQLEAARHHMEEMIHLGCLAPREVVGLRLEVVAARIELSDWEEALRELGRVEALVPELEPDCRVGTTVRMQGLRLKVGYHCQDEETAARAAGVIRELCGADAAEMKPDDLALGLYSLSGYTSFAGSSLRALEILEELPERSALSWEIAMKLSMLRSAVCLRLGRWDEAEHVLRRACREAETHRDVRFSAHLLNNRAALALGRGRWAEVEELYGEVERLTRPLSQKLQLRSTARLNRADASWYGGRTRRAKSQLERLLAELDATGTVTRQGEIHAGLGLIDAQQRKLASAGEHADRMRELNCSAGIGSQGKFKPAWLTALFLWEEDPEGALFHLAGAARGLRDADRVSALKLRCVHALFASLPTAPEGVGRGGSEESLRRAGLTWFRRFARRWMRQAGYAVP